MRLALRLTPALLALTLLAACSSGSGAASQRSDPKQASTVSSTAGPSTTASVPESTVWLCKPGLVDNPCEADLTTAVLTAGGGSTIARPTPAADPPIDCFYVYPTVSSEKSANSDLVVGDDERAVAIAQASRFSQVCKVYAPMYRQATLSAILGQSKEKPDRAIAYGDVLATWKDYLANYNHGRGVVLIGHSQGTFMLTQLVAKEIDLEPDMRKLLVSALLLGGQVTVPPGKDVGGSFKNVPACRSADQAGCVVAYSAFLEEPPHNSLFGRAADDTHEVLCVNPAGLGHGNGSLEPYFPTKAPLLGSGLKGTPTDVSAPWVSYPSRWQAHCEHRDGASWLQIDDASNPGDARHASLVESLGATWGLHLVDVNIAYGNLVDLVKAQAAAWEG